MKYSIPSLILLASALTVHGQTTIANQVGDLSFSYTGGASQDSGTASSLSVATARNSGAFASLPSAYDLAIGDTMTVSFGFTLSNTPTDTASSVDISFSNSEVAASNGGTIWDGTFDFGVQLDPVTTSQGLQFRSGSSNNEGKFNTDQAFGTSTHTLTFLIERTGTDEMSMTFSSPTISSTARTRATTTPTGVVDTFGLAFRGDAWNEDFSGSPNIATIDGFTIETTGSAIPEPSSFALLAGLCGLAYVALRRRGK